MTSRQTLLAAAMLALSASPALAQGHQHAQPAQAEQEHDMGATAMICSMGMLPHPGMGGGMMGQGRSGMMQQGGMQHGAMMGGAKPDSAGRAAHAGGMQHGAMAGGMQHAAGAAAMQHGAGAGMSHPVTPTMLVHHAKDIELTDDQVAKVSQLAKTSQAACEQHLDLARQGHEAAAALLSTPGSVDVSAYEARLRETMGHVIQAHVGVVKAGTEAAALLTPAQREKLAAHEK